MLERKAELDPESARPLSNEAYAEAVAS